MDFVHDAVQLGINLLAAPTQTLRVLAHLKTRYSHTTGIGSLARSIKQLGILEHLDSFWSRRHVGTLTDSDYTVGNKCTSIVAVDFVLCC